MHQVALTYSPSTEARARKMQEWLAPGGDAWCPVVLPPVHPDDFQVTGGLAAGTRYTNVHHISTNALPELFFKIPSSHVRELEAHKVASAYVHLRALQCFVPCGTDRANYPWCVCG